VCRRICVAAAVDGTFLRKIAVQRPDTTMNWLPVAENFRERLRAANASDDRFNRLAELAQFRLGFLETIQLDNAVRAAAANVPLDFQHVRLAVLSSSTIDHFAPPIRVAGLRRRLLVDVHSGGFGQYRQELLDPTSSLHVFKPQAVLLSLSAHEAIAGIPLDATADVAERAIGAVVSDLRELWRRARDSFGASVIQQSFLDVSPPVFGNYDRLVPGSPARLTTRLNDLVAEAASAEGVALLDIARASARDGLDAWFDVTRWLQGKIEIAPQAAPMYGELLARLLAAQRGQSKKCLVLDLDNTLWGGVIGDDGLEGIRLGQGSAVGEAHAALQRYAKQLKNRGVILAVCSKNDPTIAETAFRDHSEMVLRRSDIAAFVANWTDKAENLRLIAEQLNIGLDSLVFVDDNPVERARIREALPMVAVPELPADAAHYVRCLSDAGYFEAISFTDEDRDRASQYAANAEREALRGTVENVDDFLRGLDMTAVSGPVTQLDLARATQLINKTNQFNTTTRRYTAEELSALVSDPQNLALQFRLVDRFGDNGLVSVMLLRPLRDAPSTFDIENWVMSCRVFGRRLEFEAMNVAVEVARAKGAEALRADYLPTKKNAVVSGLFESLGFVHRQTSELPPGATRWTLDLGQYRPHHTHITRKATT
jgi:FkbH-like protein